MAQRSKLGWIGTGRMGYAMAERLAKGGCRHHGLEPHARQGRAARASTARRSPTQLDRPRRVRHRLRHGVHLGRREGGDRGPAASCRGTRRSRSWSSNARRSRSKARRELRAMLAATRHRASRRAGVSGNAKVIKAGRLSFVVLGPQAAFDAALPYLDMIGAGASYVGEGELARIVKICHNVLLGVVIQIARRDHHPRAEGRRAAPRVPRLPEQERDGLDVHALQDAGARQPRLQGHVHAEAAAQGPRPRPGCRRAASRCRCRSRRSRATSCRR